jgi:hypothetical protein
MAPIPPHPARRSLTEAPQELLDESRLPDSCFTLNFDERELGCVRGVEGLELRVPPEQLGDARPGVEPMFGRAEQPRDQRPQLGIEVDRERPDRRVGVEPERRGGELRGVDVEQRAVRHLLPQRHAEREQVGRGARVCAPEDLGGGIPDAAEAGCVGPVREGRFRPGQVEVDQHRIGRPAQEDVRRFDVAVHARAAVDGAQRVAQVKGDARQGLRRDVGLREGRAVDPLLHDPDGRRVLDQLVHGDQVGVVDPQSGPELGSQIVVGEGDIVARHLDGYRPAGARVDGPEHLTEGASPDRVVHPVTSAEQGTGGGAPGRCEGRSTVLHRVYEGPLGAPGRAEPVECYHRAGLSPSEPGHLDRPNACSRL